MSTQIQNGSSSSSQQPLSRYESQKRRDWNTFGQYLRNQSPPVPLSQCNFNHVLDFLRYLDQFGKTKVHLHGCIFFGQPTPPAPCACPLRQAWGSLDALIGRLRAAYEEHGGSPETNPFGGGAIRVYLREVKECQAKARGIPYKKKKKKRNPILKGTQRAKDIEQQASWDDIYLYIYIYIYDMNGKFFILYMVHIIVAPIYICLIFIHAKHQPFELLELQTNSQLVY